MSIRMKSGHVIKSDGILTADDLAPSMKVTTYREWIQRVQKESRLARLIMDGKNIREDPQGEPVKADIEFGRWVVSCPVCGPTAVENVTPNDPIMFCFNCCNEENDFHLRPVIFPSPGDRKLIEAALMRREHRDMFWKSYESAHDLDLQNANLAARGKLKK